MKPKIDNRSNNQYVGIQYVSSGKGLVIDSKIFVIPYMSCQTWTVLPDPNQSYLTLSCGMCKVCRQEKRLFIQTVCSFLCMLVSTLYVNYCNLLKMCCENKCLFQFKLLSSVFNVSFHTLCTNAQLNLTCSLQVLMKDLLSVTLFSSKCQTLICILKAT